MTTSSKIQNEDKVKTTSKQTVKLAKLHEKNLIRLRDLEKEMDQDVCLLAIKKSPLFILEAKLGPNLWKSIKEVYPESAFKPFYPDFDAAKAAKSELKLFFKRQNNASQKRPIRIRQLEPSDQLSSD